nr:endonuclease exonuclease phosphatase [uncultured bacterium]
MSRQRVVLFLFLSLSLAVTFYCNRDSADKPSGGPSPAQKERPLPDTITAAFYNVENLFDFNRDGTEYDEYKPGWFGWTEEVQKKKLANTAQVIAALGADIVGLCEVENKNALKELQGELDRIGAVYPYAVVGDAPKSATVTALLSKFPVREKAEYPVEGFRSILEARVARGGDEVAVFVNHWPSKRHPESKRLEAAQILRRRLESLPAGLDYIVMGDFNASHDEFASFHTAGFNDTENRTGINHVLKTVAAGAGPQSPERFICKGELADCADCHYNLWLELPEEKRMSYVYRGASETIDNMLLPPSMFDSSGYSYLDGSFEVFTWDGELLRQGVPYRWQMVFKGKEKYHTGKGYSDHLPIKASFARASVLLGDTPPLSGNCEAADPQAVTGDFEVTVDGWMSGDSRFVVARDTRYAVTGTYSLRVGGMHETQNRTAAKARLQPDGAKKYLTMAMRGSGNVSVRIRRPDGNWAYFNAPDFAQSKSARYKGWKSGSWAKLKFPLPPTVSGNDDVEVELRAGKGEPAQVWIDRVRLE